MGPRCLQGSILVAKNGKKNGPFWKPKSRFLVSFLSDFFAWILHEISVAILRLLGPRWEENPAKIASKSVEQMDGFLYASWNRFS